MRNKQVSTRRKVVVATIGIVAAAGLFVIWLNQRREPLDQAGKNVLSQMGSQNFKAIHRYLLEEEVSANELSPADVEAIFKDVIEPNLKAAGLEITPGAIYCQKLPMQGYCAVSCTDVHGESQELKLAMYRIGNKPVTTLGSMIISAWSMRHHAETRNYEWNEAQQRLAFESGKQRDDQQLKNLGYKTLYQISLGGAEPEIVKSNL